jgi:uncharacterized protein (TIGR00251 family)
MIRVEERDGICFFHIRVQPRAARNEIVGDWEGACKVRVTAAPVDGAANAALVGLLAKTLDLPRSGSRIVRGQTSRHKLVSVSGVSAARLEALLNAHSAGG